MVSDRGCHILDFAAPLRFPAYAQGRTASGAAKRRPHIVETLFLFCRSSLRQTLATLIGGEPDDIGADERAGAGLATIATR